MLSYLSIENVIDLTCHFVLGIVLITDAIAALGLPPGEHKLGTMDMMIDDKVARIKGTDTLAGRYGAFYLFFYLSEEIL